MPSDDMDEAFEIVAQLPEHATFLGPKGEETIAAAENLLCVAFSQSYRRFLARLGAGSFGFAEFYGIVDENFTTASVPDAVWVTRRHREHWQLPPALIAVYAVGDGTIYYLDTSRVDQRRECPIVSYLRSSHEVIATKYSDFAMLFLSRIRAAKADIESGDEPDDFERVEDLNLR